MGDTLRKTFFLDKLGDKVQGLLGAVAHAVTALEDEESGETAQPRKSRVIPKLTMAGILADILS